jgi:hypothetical protein
MSAVAISAAAMEIWASLVAAVAVDELGQTEP